MVALRELQEALTILDAKEGWADICDRLYEDDPYNEEKERNFDMAYKEEWEAYSKVIDILVKITGIDRPTANTMLHKERSKVEEIVKGRRNNKC